MTEKNQRDIELDGRKMTVHVLRVRDSAKVERMRVAAVAAPVDDADVQLLRELYYPVLAGCTDGDVPTEDEFIDMSILIANEWFDAVDKLNPGLLPQPSEEPAKKES